MVFALALGCGDSSPPVDASVADAAWSDAGTGDASMGDAGVDAALPPAMAVPLPLTQHVDPFVGTGGLGFGVGSASPGPQTPFGFARPAPDTSTDHGAPGFSHCAPYIWGFSQVRPHGMGIAEYGAIGLMPTDGMDTAKTIQTGYRQSYSHDDERAEVGFYEVRLSDGIDVGITAGDRVALYRIAFPAGTEPTLIVDPAHWIGEHEIDRAEVNIDAEAGEVWGTSHFSGGYSGRFGGQPVHYAMRILGGWESQGTWRDGELEVDGERAEGEGRGSAGGWVAWPTSADSRVVEVAVGLSFVDVAGARRNLEAELEEFDRDDFEAIRERTVATWEATLRRVEIEVRRPEDAELFYTALYHSLLMPTLGSDADDRYRGVDGEVHTAEGYRYYTDFSLWDTFRTQVPLLSLLYPEWQRDHMRSLAAMAADGGYMPRWPLGTGYTGGMVGESATVAIADAWVKGIRDFDLPGSYEAMRRTALAPTEDGAAYNGRSGITAYSELGYMSLEAGGSSVSRTQEYAYNDWALAYLARELDRSEDAALFAERAGNWRNLWDPERRFFVGRHADGRFSERFSERSWLNYYVEGNAQQYRWYVPHDLVGLAEVFGGEQAFLAELEAFFEQSTTNPMTVLPGNFYWHGNEPDIHAPWIPAAFDRPLEAARWTRWVMETFYNGEPDGLPGNDDSGTLSAWYVFSALGLYPIAGEEHYLLGAPTLARAILHLGAGDLEIEGHRGENWYLDDDVLSRSRVSHAQLAGRQLRFGRP